MVPWNVVNFIELTLGEVVVLWSWEVSMLDVIGGDGGGGCRRKGTCSRYVEGW